YVQAHAPDKKIGIINFDAHFDLREAEHATSGTPFLQAARLSEQYQKQFNYLCIGVANHANTKILFDTADALNCSYLRDHEVNIFNLNNVLAAVDAFIEKVDCLYVTIDLDVFTAAVAPGVSAPAVKGIDLATFEAIFKHIQETGKIKLLDIAECNPKFDLDNRTAKLAAYIVYQYLFS
ncbi:TPA: arginase family protein, partial [Acinetobacter baumannii]|nr:arginase family protein [Acinetobacter baumannii]